MAVYIILYSLILIFCLSKRLYAIRKIRILLLCVLCLFLCTGYMTGSDWRPYEALYNNLNNLGDVKSYSKEIGFAYLLFFVKKIGIGFWEFWILIKIICFYTIIKYLSFLTNNNYKWAILYFYSYFALFYFIDNPMRNLMSATLFLVSYKYLIERNLVKYICVVLLCSMIHSSSIVFIPLYFLFSKKHELSNKSIIIICLAFYLLLLILWNSGGRMLVANIVQMVSGFDSRIVYYYEEFSSSRFISFGFIVVYSLLGLILSQRNYIANKTKYGYFLVCMSMIYVLTYTLGFFIPIMGRLSMFCYIPFLSAFSVAIMGLSKVRYFVAVIYVSSFFLIITHGTVTRDFRYVPYSTYLEYIGKPKPSFSARSSYNPLHSPYGSGDYQYDHFQ